MKLTLILFKNEVDSPFLTTIRKPLLTLRLLECCVSGVKKYRLGTSKCHDKPYSRYLSQNAAI